MAAKAKEPRISELKTTAEVSEITGQARRTILVHAKTYGLGRMVGGTMLYSDEDIAELMKHRAREKED